MAFFAYQQCILHLCDIAKEYSSQLDELHRNKRVSSRHTFISFEVSKRAQHAKGISEKVFLTYYLPNVDRAIERAEKFTGSTSLLLDSLGTNIPELFRILRSAI